MCRCCYHWALFEVDRSNIFRRVVGVIRNAVEAAQTLSDPTLSITLCYWLTNTVTLVRLLQKLATPTAGPNARISGVTAGSNRTGAAGASLAAASTPAQLFRQQLLACMHQIYSKLVDNVMQRILPLLNVRFHWSMYCHCSVWSRARLLPRSFASNVVGRRLCKHIVITALREL